VTEPARPPTAQQDNTVRTTRPYLPMEEIAISPQQSTTAPDNRSPGKQSAPWSTPGKWTITTEAGSVTSGYLPAWAEDDPTEIDIPLNLLPARLAAVNHRNFFEGTMMPLTTDTTEVEEDAVFEGSIDCNPYDPDPRLRVPVVNLQVCVGRWILGLDPHGLAETAAKLRAQADLLDEKVRPALVAALEDWVTHHQH
jgi:hypothetical protein